MAMAASRYLNRAKQLYAAQAILQNQHAMPARSFAKEAAPLPLKGDEMLKDIFFDVKKKFDIARGILKKEKITIDPEDPAAVAQCAKVMKMIREKAGILSESQKIKQDIQQKTQDIPDERTYLLTCIDIRVKKGLVDHLGIEAMMMDALDKVEKEIKKPLLRADKKGMDLLMSEFDKVNQKLGIKAEDLPKYEEELELELAKDQLQDLRKDCVESMQAQLKQPEFQDEEMVDPKDLDLRTFI